MHEYNGSGGNGNAPEKADPTLALLEQMGLADPRLQMMMELIRNHPVEADEPPAVEKQPDRLKQIVARYKQLKYENERLWERLDLLAAALGMCPNCCGEDEACEVCQGNGVPGSYVPDRDAFTTYVLPAIRRLRAVRRPGHSVPRDTLIVTEVAGDGRQMATER